MAEEDLMDCRDCPVSKQQQRPKRQRKKERKKGGRGGRGGRKGETWGREMHVGVREKWERNEVPAVYHVAPNLVNSGQNVVALNWGGMITVPPEWRGARNPARRPWTWNNGITR
jgi:hypothetical protein